MTIEKPETRAAAPEKRRGAASQKKKKEEKRALVQALGPAGGPRYVRETIYTKGGETRR